MSLPNSSAQDAISDDKNNDCSGLERLFKPFRKRY